MLVSNALMPRPEQMQGFFGRADDGPMVMVNLLKFRHKALYSDGRNPEMSGRDAYRIYGVAVQKCLEMVGGRAIFSGDVTGLLLGDVEQLWDMVALAAYPSAAAMVQMVALPEYQGIEIHRFAGLAGQLNIRTAPGVMPV